MAINKQSLPREGQWDSNLKLQRHKLLTKNCWGF